MTIRTLPVLLLLAVFTLGCDSASAPSETDTDSTQATTDPTDNDAASVEPETSPLDDGPVADDTTAETIIELTPENTKIEFVGNHTGDDPRPRQGRFEQFSGTAVVVGGLQSVSVEIETASLKTEIDNLTNHLKNADFFDVNQYPTASFSSTQIEDHGDGTWTITGDLTLLGQTHSITFPATVSTDNGLKLTAEFEIDRTTWGMLYGPDKVEVLVPMTITIDG